MISSCGASPERVRHGLRRADDRARLHLVDLGWSTPRRTPRVPSIGLVSASSCTRLSVRSSSSRSSDCSIRARSVSRSTSSRWGRNSCSGGSSRRIVTGSPRISSNRPSKSCLLERQELVERRAPLVLLLGHDHPAHLRLAVRGHEHVLGAAEADPLGAELARLGGVLGGVGVRAHARACAARPPSRAPSGTPRSPSAPRAARRRWSRRRRCRRSRAGRPPRAAVPFTRIVFAATSISSADAPDTHGLPMPRATSAAWLALPPSEVRIPFAAWKPATSSASVNGRTRITSRSLVGRGHGLRAP